MAKQSRKKSMRPKRRSFRKRTSKAYGKMVGGDFTQEENQQLLGLGFSQQDIQLLAGTGVGLNIIQISLTQVNPATGAPFTPQELIQSVNEANEEINQLDISGISNASEDDHNLDDGQNLNHEQNLNDSYNYSMNTTSEETNLNDSNVFTMVQQIQLWKMILLVAENAKQEKEEKEEKVANMVAKVADNVEACVLEMV